MNLAGLDIGTTGCKISVFAPGGAYLGGVYKEYPVIRNHNEHEIDAAAIWAAVQEVIKEAAGKYAPISGIGVTSFGETFVLLDKNDKPLCGSMLYTDPRGDEECRRLVDMLGEERITKITGIKPHAMYSLPKFMWIREHSIETYIKTERALLMEDYIVYMLTGTAQIDYSLATRTMAFDIQSLTWSKLLCDASGVDMDLLSTPVPTGTSAGALKPEIAQILGLSETTIAVSVSHDQVAAAVGSGVFDASATVDGAGTVECMTPVFTEYNTAKMAENNYCIVPFITPGSYVTYAFSYTGGALVKWFVDNLAGFAAQTAKDKGVRVYSELEDAWNGEPTGILVLPHFAGAATPYMDAGSKGAMVGLTLSHTQQDIHLAIMEGVCYEMRLNQERLKEAGVPVAPLKATGGGANSKVWLQMKADVLGLPVTALQTSEAGATGSAMLVGVATGVYSDLEQAAQVMVKEKQTYTPRVETHAKYTEVYERYKQLYAAVRPLI